MIRVLLLLGLAACNVGAPLVDEVEEEPEGIGPIQCNEPPSCDALDDVELPAHRAEPIAIKACTRLCRLDGDKQVGDGTCAREAIETLPVSAMCEDIALEGEEPDAELNLSGVDWQNVNLSWQSDQPLSAVFSGGALGRVYIVLTGPVTLRIADLDRIVDLRLHGIRTEQGAPSVELSSLRADVVSIGTPDAAFQGELVLRSLHMSNIDAHAEMLHVESGLLENAKLRVEHLTMADTSLKVARVEASQALLSFVTLQDTRADFCGDARVVSAQLTRTALTACADSSLRVYGSNFGSSSLDGPVELAEVSFENVRLAASEPTRIRAYNSHFKSNQLCSKLELFALQGVSDIQCSDCAEEFVQDAQPACAPMDSKALMGNVCDAWRELDVLPVCSDDVPAMPDRIRG